MPKLVFPVPLTVGNDICKVERVRRLLQKYGRRFVNKILAENEARPPEVENTGNLSKLEFSSADRTPSLDRASQFLAGRFAAKEAVMKAFAHAQLSLHSIRITSLGEANSRRRSNYDSNIRSWVSGPQDAPKLAESAEESIRRFGPPIAVIKDTMVAQVSISHEGDYAVATCVAWHGPSLHRLVGVQHAHPVSITPEGPFSPVLSQARRKDNAYKTPVSSIVSRSPVPPTYAAKQVLDRQKRLQLHLRQGLVRTPNPPHKVLDGSHHKDPREGVAVMLRSRRQRMVKRQVVDWVGKTRKGLNIDGAPRMAPKQLAVGNVLERKHAEVGNGQRVMMKQDSRKDGKADKKQSKDTGGPKSAAVKGTNQKAVEAGHASKIQQILRQMY